MGLPIARLAERRSRARIIAVSIAIFSGFGALASQARSFALLLLCRIGVGIGDAGAIGPPVSSLLGRSLSCGKARLGHHRGLAGSADRRDGGRSDRRMDGATCRLALVVRWARRFPASWRPRLRCSLCASRGAAPSMPAASPRADRFPPTGQPHAFSFRPNPPCGMSCSARRSPPSRLNGMGQFFARYFVSVFHIGPAQAGGMLGLLVVVAMSSGFLIGGFGVDWAVRARPAMVCLGPLHCLC